MVAPLYLVVHHWWRRTRFGTPPHLVTGGRRHLGSLSASTLATDGIRGPSLPRHKWWTRIGVSLYFGTNGGRDLEPLSTSSLVVDEIWDPCLLRYWRWVRFGTPLYLVTGDGRDSGPFSTSYWRRTGFRVLFPSSLVSDEIWSPSLPHHWWWMRFETPLYLGTGGGRDLAPHVWSALGWSVHVHTIRTPQLRQVPPRNVPVRDTVSLAFWSRRWTSDPYHSLTTVKINQGPTPTWVGRKD